MPLNRWRATRNFQRVKCSVAARVCSRHATSSHFRALQQSLCSRGSNCVLHRDGRYGAKRGAFAAAAFCRDNGRRRKAQIREAAEREEAAFYSTDPVEWLAALAPLGTDEHEPYLEIAPCIIAVFAERYGYDAWGNRRTHYYVNESIGIATGFLLVALHPAGLVALTHTPSSMRFPSGVLGRPVNERAVMLVVTGFPAEGARVPKLTPKPLSDIATFL